MTRVQRDHMHLLMKYYKQFFSMISPISGDLWNYFKLIYPFIYVNYLCFIQQKFAGPSGHQGPVLGAANRAKATLCAGDVWSGAAEAQILRGPGVDGSPVRHRDRAHVCWLITVSDVAAASTWSPARVGRWPC